MNKLKIVIALLIFIVGSNVQAGVANNNNMNMIKKNAMKKAKAVKHPTAMPVEAAAEAPAKTLEEQNMVVTMGQRARVYTDATKRKIMQAVADELTEVVKKHPQNLIIEKDTKDKKRLAVFVDPANNLKASMGTMGSHNFMYINEIDTKPIYVVDGMPMHQKALKDAFHAIQQKYADRGLMLEKVAGKPPANVIAWYEEEQRPGVIGAPKWYLFLAEKMPATIEQIQEFENKK